MPKQVFKYSIVSIPILFFTLLHFQGITGLFKVEALNKVATSPDTKLSAKAWWDGNYQEQKATYLNDAFGFRSTFLRIARDYDFRLFQQMKGTDVVVGKENYLFGKNYIASYNTLIHDHEGEIRGKALYFKAIENALAKCDKTMITMLAPNKAGFFNEFLPDYIPKKNSINSNEAFCQTAQQNGMNTLDFHTIFIQKKGKSRYPLFTQLGAHWSNSTIVEFVVDTLLQRIATARHIAKPIIEITADNTKSKCESGDCDYEWMANLYAPIKEFPLSYPSALVKNTQDTKKLNVVLFGDSFYAAIQDANIFKDIFKSTQFVWYKEYIRNDATREEKPYQEIDFPKLIDSTDIFIFLASPTNVGEMGWGNQYNLADYVESKRIYTFPEIKESKIPILLPDYLMDKTIPEEELEKIKNSMRATPEWIKMLKNTAREKNIPLEYVLQDNARFMYRESHK
jgi:hypothetical protein